MSVLLENVEVESENGKASLIESIYREWRHNDKVSSITAECGDWGWGPFA